MEKRVLLLAVSFFIMIPLTCAQTYFAETREIDTGNSFAVGNGDTIIFSFGNRNYSLTADSVNPYERIIKLKFNPELAVAIVFDGDRKIDINNDSIYDLFIKFESIEPSGNGRIFIKKINEPIKKDAAFTGESVANIPKNDISTFSIVGVALLSMLAVLIVAAVIIIFYVKRY